MKLLYLLLLQVLVLSIFSCSKEESFERRRVSDEKNDPLLVKMTTQPAGFNYTMVTHLEYDNNRKLIRLNSVFEGEVDELHKTDESKYIRNSDGMIKQIISEQKLYDEDGKYLGKDSMTMNLFVNTLKQYEYGIISFVFASNEIQTDSIKYTYNEKGRISRVEVYSKPDNTADYVPSQLTNYTYDENENIIKMIIEFTENVQDPPQVLNLKYNTNPSPMNMGDEALLQGFLVPFALFSPNCLIELTDLTERDNTWNITYEYNDLNKPTKGIFSNPVTNEVLNYTYFYQ